MALLGGCNMVVMDPSGDIANQQRDLILISTGLMLVVIIPVMLLTVLFAWKYRQSNKQATYEPEWSHSTKLEVVIWTVPLAIIAALGTVTWITTHSLDPYKPLDRIGPNQPVASHVEPLEIQVVALDWKWLFFYPEYGVATVNEFAAPVDRPITFNITASTVMNSFFVPALAGQIYAMPGMETKLHAVINEPGTFEGFSANYSGAGFSKMRFSMLGMSDHDFDDWIEKVSGNGGKLSRSLYLELERPSEDEPVRYYSEVDPSLYERILNMCVEPGRMCMGEMMAIDAQGGLGVAGVYNVFPDSPEDSNRARLKSVLGPEPAYISTLCTTEDPFGKSYVGRAPNTKKAATANQSPVQTTISSRIPVPPADQLTQNN
nr:ubiquinol oxidase subunit II [Roseibium sp. RKSG952]